MECLWLPHRSNAPLLRLASRLQPPSLTNSPRIETGIEYSKARAVRETYMARLAKIDFEERTEKVVSSDDVKVAAFNRISRFPDCMLNIPDRVAVVVAAETDPKRIYELLATELRAPIRRPFRAGATRRTSVSDPDGTARPPPAATFAPRVSAAAKTTLWRYW